MRTITRGLAIIAVGTALVSSCAHRGGAAGGSLAPVRTLVHVTNQYALAMDVFAVGSGISHRLGTVSPGIDARFDLPEALVAGGGQVEFVARSQPTGPEARSGAVTLTPGHSVEFLITQQL